MKVLRPFLAAIQAALGEIDENTHAWTYHIRGFDGSLYLSRSLFPRVFGARPLLHRIWREDRDDVMHNHPWAWARFLIVSGGYVEERLLPNGDVKITTFAPGDVNRIDLTTLHRVRTVWPNTWTVGVVGPRVQDWGFLVDGAIVPHKEYFARIGHQQLSEVS